jgi:hypothetical protein
MSDSAAQPRRDSETTGPDRSPETETAHRAGAFDIRNFIGLLIGLYGIVLVVMGLVGTSAADLRRAGGFNVNLWAGVGMVVVAAAFMLWARKRPVVVAEDSSEAGREDREEEALS